MIGGNPNQPNNPFAPQMPQNARTMAGGSNPYGFGMERLAGALALQRNKPGMATNTVPLPGVRAALGGYGGHGGGQSGGMPYQYNGVQDALNHGLDWHFIHGLARGGRNGFTMQDYYRARQTNSANSLTGGTGGSEAANAAYAAQSRAAQAAAAPKPAFNPLRGY